ncbi:SSI family serine proteinase inhibitor [Streptomyces sp. Ru87]|uniref:SSI family serine proteinase inhibitor n=1 Tax=Streptomyces sp. Ru87 TaxID=2044307 RepID=UPI000BF57FA6|nr:SSI family serine proteinase inhibitor [Streptomyces sp. Ru87]PGH52227.1 hypothetical protein CRI70_02510 [Streptomyces sp. Ru87]
MRRPRRLVLPVLATTAFAATAFAVPATAAAAVPAATAAPEASLTLTIVPDELSETQPVTTVTLECGPAGGSHPAAADACRLLAAVDGDFTKIEPAHAACPEYYAPVTVVATGNWGDRGIAVSARYTNRDCAAVGTDGVFAF